MMEKLLRFLMNPPCYHNADTKRFRLAGLR